MNGTFKPLFVCVTAAVILSAIVRPVLAQSPLNDDRVMLQGFYWESCRFGHPDRFPTMGKEHWYDIVKKDADAIRAARFNMVWLPQPCYAGENSAGYNPKEYFKLDNSYGSFTEQRALLKTLLSDGVEPIADIVINHRDSEHGWTGFVNPAWGLWSICGDDEAFTDPRSEAYNAPMSQRGAPEEWDTPYANHKAYAYPAFRDIDHTNVTVRRDIVRFLLELKSAGYRGWRYDMVHGYNARWVALYNRLTKPTFTVGEYDWGAHEEARGWVLATETSPGKLASASDVFDFYTLWTLKDNKTNVVRWGGEGNGPGLIGDTTGGIEWKQKAVTFIENHDTGYRTNDDGTPQPGHDHDTFANNWEAEQAYAFILTHPGVPCVYWKHYFDSGADLRNKIRALINARKVAGVNSGSTVVIQNNAIGRGVYAAKVSGTHGSLYVRIGGSDADWTPSMSHFSGYREYAVGSGWHVWVALPGNPAFQQAPIPRALSAPPVYRPGNTIEVSAKEVGG